MDKDLFRFVLILNDEKISERTFPGDMYNQYVRFGVDIKAIASNIIKGFQSILSTDKKDLNYVIHGIDVLKEYTNSLKINNISISDSKLKPASKNGKYIENEGGKSYYECLDEKFKFVLYINDNMVIERNFFVKNYNPTSRFSLELSNEMNYIVNDKQIHIKK